MVKVDPLTFEATPLLEEDMYDISLLNVENDEITFSGLRYSDGVRVLCEITDGKVKVLQENLVEDIRILEKV